MTPVALADLTEEDVKTAGDKGIVVQNHWGDVYTIRTDGLFPGYICQSALSLAIIYVLTLGEIQRFCRNEPTLQY